MIYITDEDYSIAESNGINKKLLYTRVYQLKWPMEQARTQKPRSKSYYQLALDNGIGLNRYYKRIEKGWSPLEAATIMKGIKD